MKRLTAELFSNFEKTFFRFHSGEN